MNYNKAMWISTVLIVVIYSCFYVNADNNDHSKSEDHGSNPRKPLCNHPPLHSISVMDDFPLPEYFHEWFVLPGQPVLFKSVLNKMDYPAYTQWTDDYLRENFGDNIVQTEKGKKETRNPLGLRDQTMKDFLGYYKNKDIYMVQHLREKMKDEILVPKCLKCGGFQNRFSEKIMWFSSGGTRSVLHLDTYDNINCLFDGVKEMTLIDRKHHDRVVKNGFNFEKGYSHVDVDGVDEEKFPQFIDIPWMSARMQKGDCLFIPRNWFHQVNSFGDRNLAINIFFGHSRWFNASDCKLVTNYDEPMKLSECIQSSLLERVRLYIFDLFWDKNEITKRDFLLTNHDTLNGTLPEPTSEEREITEKVFTMVDLDKNFVITWDEIVTFDINKLMDEIGDKLPFVPSDLMNTDEIEELETKQRAEYAEQSESAEQSEHDEF